MAEKSPDTIAIQIKREEQYDPNTGKWYRKSHDVLSGKPAFLTFTAGTSAQIYTNNTGQVMEMQSLTINNRESSSVLVELFDASTGDPAAATLVYKVTVPATTVWSPSQILKGYTFATGIRGRVTTASTGVDISIGGQLASKT